MSKPYVSVLIDTYNHERFIERAITSVLEQDMPMDGVEILVVDDGSADRTPEIVRRFEPRVRLLQKPNGGQASAFNAGIPQCQGEIVAFLDGDDWWAPEKLSRVTKAMAADPSLGIVGHGIVMVFLDGSRLSETLREGFCFQANTVAGARLLRVRGSLLGTSRMAIRAELLRRIGPVPEGLTVQADEYLSTLASALAPARILPETLAYYRLHEANGFQFSTPDPLRLRRKQEVLATLSRALDQELRARGILPETVRAIIGRIQADADRIRLTLDGGWPWETVKTEQTLYAVAHPEASLSQLVFKVLILLPAIVMPPRFYYSVRQKVSTSRLYIRARKRWLPIPGMPHLKREGGAGS
jgi:glycosyltransferase involved in cell wall biosynthesis